MEQRSGPLLKACDLFSKTSRGRGEREYLVGYLGGVKVLIFKVHDAQADGPTHTLFFAPRPPRQDRQESSGQVGHSIPSPVRGGRQSHEPLEERADAWSREQQARHLAELAAKFAPDEEPPF